VQDFRRGEEAGFLLCSISRALRADHLLARTFIQVPEDELQRFSDGSVLSWSAQFNSRVLERAVEMNATPVLVHSHGPDAAVFSVDDQRREAPLFSAFSRIVAPLPTGTIALGGGLAEGSFWTDGNRSHRFERLIVISETLRVWPATAEAQQTPPVRERLNRQSIAIPNSDQALARATVGIVGLSGGGSHVVQQLAHIGVGHQINVDNELVERSNLGRLVGATEDDVDVTAKTDVAKRVATRIDSTIDVVKVNHRFPSPEAIAALKDADIIVTALDSFRAREMLNRFCRRHLIPQVDIGMVIRTKEERLTLAHGQLIVSIPGLACLRCWFLTDATLAQEPEPGYDRDPEAPGDPQVVSMNGVLASEACNCVLDMITAYSGGTRGARVWRYDGRAGELLRGELPARHQNCDACAEEGLGDRRA
jgi:molybdopterin/thiamine biosynthesis adenylyltransferase